MNKRQKLVQQQFLNNEEEIIKRLDSIYDQSLKDFTHEIEKLDSSIESLQKALNSIEDNDIGDLARTYLRGKNLSAEEARQTLQSMLQSKVYQKDYQAALKKQVGCILDNLHQNEFKSVSDYLEKCYEDGFVGTMFDLQGQGIPIVMPIDQESMVRAIQIDSKLSQGLYKRLGEDISILKRNIASEVSRGISTGMSFKQVARQVTKCSNIGYNNAIRIARTEGHRIQCQAGMDACYKAKDKGADVVKQWDATLDGRTRESHQRVDGEIRELDKKFSNGLMYPGDTSGGASEVINCRCALLQRARWALDDNELQTLKDRAAYFGLDKTDQFNDYKKKYLKAVEQSDEIQKKYGFKKIKGDHSIDDDAKASNPHYKDGKEYRVNCQRCVPTYEMRRRGYDVTALPAIRDDVDVVARNWKKIFDDAQWDRSVASKRCATTKQNVIDKMLEYGDGARAEVYCVWKGQSSAHVFVAENAGGKVRFIDPQSGNFDCIDYFEDMMPSRTQICRIDNLTPSLFIKGCCR